VIDFLRIVFMGTPEFAVPCLDMLVEEGCQVEAVVTQPDKPKGRGKKLASPPVKLCAQKHGIKILQPKKVKTDEFVNQLKEINPDLMVTAAYGNILPKEVLDIPKFGCINVHASLLPKYRGAAPIHWAIIKGEKVSGITTMLTDEGMDTGDILLKYEIDIPEDMTAGELHDKLSILGAKALKETILKLRAGELVHISQQEQEATKAPIINKELGCIDWTWRSRDIHNLVRGTNPWPGAYTFMECKRMRIWKTSIMADEKTGKKPGTICEVSKEGLLVATGSGLIRVEEVQFDSCRTMSIGEYICGNKICEGEILGQNQ
jgi:methionyl-tRNA formyltransferase